MKKVIVVCLAIAILATCLVGCEEKGEPIIWNGLLLGEQLPEFGEVTGKLWTNDDDELRVDFYQMSEMKFSEYVVLCRNFGYTVDSEKIGSSFEAFNEAGYELRLSFFESSKKMSVDLNAPMEMSELEWPSSKLAKSVPSPESNIGVVEYDEDDYFVIYIGEVSKEDYHKYVKSCEKKGFVDENYEEGDTYFRGENNEGTTLDINYEGANVIYIRAELKDEETQQETPTEAPTEKETEPEETKKSEENKSDKIGTEFKEAMDAYEEFMDDYVKFMKKYKKNPTDLSILTDYADYMSKYADFVEKFEEWEDQDLNTAEMAYYIEVQARVSKKLLEAAK